VDYSRLLLLSIADYRLLSIIDSLPVREFIKRIDVNFLGEPVPPIFIVSLKRGAAVFSETLVLSAKLHGVTSQNITNVPEFLRTCKRFSKHVKVPAVTRLAVRAAGESMIQAVNDILNYSWNYKVAAIFTSLNQCAVT